MYILLYSHSTKYLVKYHILKTFYVYTTLWRLISIIKSPLLTNLYYKFCLYSVGIMGIYIYRYKDTYTDPPFFLSKVKKKKNYYVFNQPK